MFEHDHDQLKDSYKVIRNLESELSVSPEIKKFIHVNNRLVKETKGSQIRLLKKWENYKKDLLDEAFRHRDEIKAIQLKKISLLVDIAFNNVPLYNKLYGNIGFSEGDIVTWGDFKKLPIINKEFIVNNIKDSISINNNQQLNTARTSGSSGVNLTISQSDSSVDMRCLLYMRHCQQMLGRKMHINDLMCWA